MRRVECGRDEPDATVDLPLQTLDAGLLLRCDECGRNAFYLPLQALDEGLLIRCDACGRDAFHLQLQALEKGLPEGVRCESAEYASAGLRADAWCEREGR